MKDKEKIDSTLQDQAAPCVNVSGTDGAIDTPLTQACSPAVHGTIDFELEDTRRRLLALRDKHGADSPAGHRCSNIIEQLQNMRDAEGDQRRHLVKGIGEQMAQLAGLTQNADTRGGAT